jgi:hypothetical protein
MYNYKNIASLKRDHRFGSRNGGWSYDAYPELETLDAGKCITIADIEGPAVITNIHSTQHFIRDDNLSEDERKAMCTRGVVLEIYYNHVSAPAVKVPLGDFFGDGCGGKAQHFSTPFVEKAPESYNCFIPMPFEKSARVMLRNETDYNLANYSFVEFEHLPSWEDNLGYFHATWRRLDFPLHGKTDQHFFHVDGCGHLIGRAWSVCTDEPFFRGFHFVMEGNNEIRIDGKERPKADYLGTEDSFGFSWGFRQPFIGIYNGMNFVQHETPSMLSIYRFRKQNPIRFLKSLDLRIDWSNEWTANEAFQKKIAEIHSKGGGWIDYATTYYWYQDGVGYEHEPLMSINKRVKPILHTNTTAE